MEERVRLELRRHGLELQTVKPLHGGACQDNYRVDATRDGAAVRFALRSDARQGLPGSISRKAEFAIIQAATAVGVQTPSAHWLTDGLVREGAHAYFMDWCEGEAIGRRVVRNPELQQARERLPVELSTSLAKLHTITPNTHGSLGSAPTSPARDALESLRAQLDAIPAPAPAIELAIATLADHLPEKEEVVLVHGDFRTGNFLVTPAGLSAILDWEFSHFGSPYEDLSWISVRDWRFNRLDQPIGGFAQRAPFYEAYTKASGRELDAGQLWWWEICGNLRWAVGSLFQGERYLSGKERDLELIAIAKRSPEMEFEALRLIKRGKL